ncbi:MAG: carbohydrate-binding family 9-like protein [Isosphaeraceae bacterium]
MGWITSRSGSWVAGALLLALAGPVVAGEPPAPRLPRGYVCLRATAPIRIDGKLDEASWTAAPWSDDFEDIEGSIRPRPRFRTRMKLLWDDRYFYVAAELEEPHIWATLTQHDSVIFHDNDFEVFIDPDGDHHEYYEFEINALNTGWDLFLAKPYRDGGPARNEWEIPGLKTAVHIDGTLNEPSDQDRTWSVEIAIPWTVLGEYAHRPVPPRPGDQWRINFSRVEWKHQIENGRYRKVANTREDNWVWSPQGVIDMHRPERWGYVQFSDRPPGVDVFRRDPLEGVRDRLVEIYHAQKRYRDENKRWAARLDLLKLTTSTPLPGESPPTLHLDDDDYRAEIRLDGREGRPPVRLWIESDSRLRVEPIRPGASEPR